MTTELHSLLHPDQQETPVPTLLQHPDTDPLPAVLVTILCADDHARTRAIKAHAKARGHRAVFVTSNPDVRAYQATGCAFEYLPDPKTVCEMSAAGDWESYLGERWRMFHSKWHPRWSADYGLTFAQYLKRCGIYGIGDHY